MTTSRVRRSLAMAATTAATGLLAACSSPASASAPGTAADAAAAGAPVTGGELTYLEHQPYTTLYAPQAGFYPNGALVNNLTARLTWQDPASLEIEPWIATDWTVNADATEYTFNLRDGVTFSDGTPLDAAAVAKNFDTYGLGAKDRGLTVSEAVNNYASSQVVDADTVTFRFSAPAPGFLQATSTINSGLVSPATLDRKLEDFGAGNAKEIIGSGPFVVASEELNQSIRLEARPDYDWAPPSFAHQGRAYLDAINIVVTPEDSVRIGSLLSGQADAARQVQAYDERQVTDAGYTVIGAPTRGVNNSLNLRSANPLLADLRVRQAITHAVNAQEVVDTLFTANYPVGTSPLASTAKGYVDESAKLAFDPTRSAQLLDGAGWTPGADGIRVKDGQRLSLTIYVAPAQPRAKETIELVSQQLAKVGVEGVVKVVDNATFNADAKDAIKAPIIQSMVGRADNDVIKSQFHTKNRNQLAGSDPALDALLEAVASTPDQAGRDAASAAVQDYLVDNAYVVPLFEEPQVYGVAPNVHGFATESVARPAFYDVWKSA